MNKINKNMWFALSVLIVICNACSSRQTDKDNSNRSEINPGFLSTVETMTATRNRRTETLTIGGKVEFDPGKIVSYQPLIDGVIEKVYFSAGDKVQQGQTLLDIRSAELSGLQSELAALQAEIRSAERETDAAREMYEDNMLSEKELLEVESKLKQTEAALARVRTDMQLFGLDKGNGVFSLKAPVSGYVVDKNVASGSTASSGGTPLFTIADLSTVWVIAHVYAGDLQFVKEKMPVTFTVLSYPGELFEGRIDHISQVFDPEDKVLKARIVMPNIELKLKPEMPVVIHLKSESDEELVALPSDALIFDDDRYFVVVKGDGDKFEIKGVNLQGSDGDISYIRSGIDAGEEVVVAGQLLIYSELNGK